MTRFLKNTISFFIVFYGSLLVIIITINYFINKKANFIIDKNIKNIVIGNSQPECAFNDTLISGFKNLAKSGETYFYNYQKLKKIIEQNPQINSVFIEFSPTNILIREDQKIWRNRYLNHHLPNYNAFLDFKDNKLLVVKNSVGYQHAMLKSMSVNLKRIATNNYNYIDSIGGYNYLKRNKINKKSDSITLNNNKQYILENVNLSTYDILYLDKTVQLCHKKNINIYLIRSPIHKQFVGNSYESIFQKIRKERYGDIEFLDFKDFPLQNDEYGDLQHLNYKGARKFSLWFNTWLQDQIEK